MKLVASLLLLAIAPAYAQNAAAVLASMDKSAASFKSLVTDLRRIEYTKAIDDKTDEFGSLRILKVKKDDTRMLFEVTKPSVYSASIAGTKFEKYLPKMNTVEIYDLGKHKDLVRQFLQLGFGVPGSELSKNYTITYAGEQTVDNQKTYKLELVPKSAEARKTFSKVELYVCEKGYSLKTNLIEPNGNYRLAEYTNVKWNAPVTEADLILKAPKNAVRQKQGAN